jgi:hypothetical protein
VNDDPDTDAAAIASENVTDGRTDTATPDAPATGDTDDTDGGVVSVPPDEPHTTRASAQSA